MTVDKEGQDLGVYSRESKDVCKLLLEAFEMSKAIVKVSPE